MICCFVHPWYQSILWFVRCTSSDLLVCRIVVLTRVRKVRAACCLHLIVISVVFSSPSSSRHLCSLHHLPTPSSFTTQALYLAQVPMSNFFAGPEGEISKSKMSMGRPMVVQAFGICNVSAMVICKSCSIHTSTIPATWPCTGAHDSSR